MVGTAVKQSVNINHAAIDSALHCYKLLVRLELHQKHNWVSTEIVTRYNLSFKTASETGQKAWGQKIQEYSSSKYHMHVLITTQHYDICLTSNSVLIYTTERGVFGRGDLCLPP